MADQCIVCLEDLDVADTTFIDDLRDAGGGTSISEPTTTHPGKSTTKTESAVVALIKPCNHVLHDECLKLWSQKANSCPICRVLYNQIEVLDKVGGTTLYEYSVEDKKQVAEYDPSDFLDDASNDQEDETPCIVCEGTDNEDVLLLCDGCDTPYHTYCLQLDAVPRGNWFCPECAAQGAYDQAEELASTQGRHRHAHVSSRTLHTQRQIRQRMRNDAWLGSWNRVSSRIHEITGVDLDFSDDEGDMHNYRSIQGRAARADREFREWRSRLRIADRQGAAEEFRRAVPVALQEALPAVSAEESRAWGAFEKARELEMPGTTASPSTSRKRKSRSVTASPAEPPTEPERKLKRPRTRRIIEKIESASASPPVAGPSRLPPNNTSPAPNAQANVNSVGEPSFLSSLLKEVEMPPSDDDAIKPALSINTNGVIQRATSPTLDFSSPVASPSPTSSAYHTPRALSTTPPPQHTKRLGSPLPLTSRVEPAYLASRYSPNRPTSAEKPNTLELRHPRPTRRQPVHLPRSGEISPVRATMSASSKEGISKIVKTALSSHWRNAEITKEQYADINREVSRKLYEIIAEQTLDDDKQKSEWEQLATTEVASAVKSLTAAAS